MQATPEPANFRRADELRFAELRAHGAATGDPPGPSP